MTAFLIWFFLLLIFGTLIINGWYLITREGMIFEGWSNHWEKKNGTKNNTLECEKLYKKFREIEKVALLCGYKGEVQYTEKYLNVDSSFASVIDQVEHHLLIHLNLIDEDKKLFLYEEETIFRFPEWLRNPLSSCPTCMASVYGTIIFWSAVSLVNTNPFEWSTHYLVTKILTWGAYCISLAFVNTFFHKQIN